MPRPDPRAQGPTPHRQDAGLRQGSDGGIGRMLLRLAPLGLLAIGALLFFAFDLGRWLSFETLAHYSDEVEAWVRGHPVLAPLGYGLFYVTVVAFSLPIGAAATVVGGFLFGLVMGTALTVVAASLGATLLFLAARRAFGAVLRKRATGVLNRMEQGFRANAFSYLLVLRLIPVFPFFLVNIAPAFLGVSLRVYAGATLLGIIPGTFVYASVGNGVGAVLERGERPDLGIIFEPAILIPMLGLALLALAPVLYKKLVKPAGDAPTDV